MHLIQYYTVSKPPILPNKTPLGAKARSPRSTQHLPFYYIGRQKSVNTQFFFFLWIALFEIGHLKKKENCQIYKYLNKNIVEKLDKPDCNITNFRKMRYKNKKSVKYVGMNTSF